MDFYETHWHFCKYLHSFWYCFGLFLCNVTRFSCFTCEGWLEAMAGQYVGLICHMSFNCLIYTGPFVTFEYSGMRTTGILNQTISFQVIWLEQLKGTGKLLTCVTRSWLVPTPEPMGITFKNIFKFYANI